MAVEKYKKPGIVLARAKEAIGKTIRELDIKNVYNKGKKGDKGKIGHVLETSWFGYDQNSRQEPDFPIADVELKSTPFINNKDGSVRAKERLVYTKIDYNKVCNETFDTSTFWKKCKNTLIMAYEYIKGYHELDYRIEIVTLLKFSKIDFVIIKQDWKIIIDKIKAGQAHLLTESDTMYLAACPKGKNGDDTTSQPFNDIPAMKRAYSLKMSYMTTVLNNARKIQNDETPTQENSIVKGDWKIIENSDFEHYLVNKLQKFYGMTEAELKSMFLISSNAKNINELLLTKMLGVDGKLSKTIEFQKANIVFKTICVESTGKVKESMSFPAFKFTEIIKENWENSELYNYLEPTKFFFAIFKKNKNGEKVFDRVMLWNIPMEDLEEVHKVWDRTVKTIKEGVSIDENGKNNLPKLTENPVAHVRPHGKNHDDKYRLPAGKMKEMTKQCFWLNNSYIEKIINENSMQIDFK